MNDPGARLNGETCEAAFLRCVCAFIGTMARLYPKLRVTVIHTTKDDAKSGLTISQLRLRIERPTIQT